MFREGESRFLSQCSGFVFSSRLTISSLTETMLNKVYSDKDMQNMVCSSQESGRGGTQTQ